MYGKFESKVAVNNIIRSDGILKLDDNAWGFGANVGLLYEVNPGTRFGITYNSPLKLNFNAQPQWNDLGPGIRLLLASRGPSLSRGPPTERYAANGNVVIPGGVTANDHQACHAHGSPYERQRGSPPQSPTPH